MKKADYAQMYESRMDEIVNCLKVVMRGDYSEEEATHMFDQTASVAEIVGYYICNEGPNALKQWLENIDGLVLTAQDREVTKILTGLYGNTSGSFATDTEKMIDFFTSSKENFLNFYSYLTEEDYTATIHDIINKIGYWHKEWYEDNPDKDGRDLGDIVFGTMVSEWLKTLNGKEN